MKRRLSNKELAALRHIRNGLVHKGRAPSVRELMGALGYKSPRSAALIISRLMDLKLVRRRENGGLQIVRSSENALAGARTVDVPLVGTVACGTPMLAEENIEAALRVSTDVARPPHRYFMLRAKGDSMDQKGIKDQDLVLVRQQVTARNGDWVVALVDGEATIKEFHRTADLILLKPRSSNPAHQPIVLNQDLSIQGVVVRVIPSVS
ncbi:MAG: transcriptional repressor LexA [Candidatus Omnitrophota bacterium]|nr:transcriptional repressor LexA [Candidatus Omnitrophota bacterium]